MSMKKRTLESVFLMTGFCEQFLADARNRACYHDNSQASHDAETILRACQMIVQAERSGDTRYARFLISELQRSYGSPLPKIDTGEEAKSRLLCTRCGHSEDDHNWSTGPCNVKNYNWHCVCYAFVSPLIDTKAEINRAEDAGQDVYEVFS